IAMAISKHGIPVKSAMIKAAAPITGGKSCPLDDAATSTPPAICSLKPVLFISGIVNVPVVTALATELPEIDPIIPDETTAAFAGPPLNEPTSDRSEEHTSELQSRFDLVCRLLLEKNNKQFIPYIINNRG